MSGQNKIKLKKKPSWDTIYKLKKIQEMETQCQKSDKKRDTVYYRLAWKGICLFLNFKQINQALL